MARRRERGHFLTGFVVTLGFAMAAILIYAAYVLYVKEPALAPAIPDAGVSAAKPRPPSPRVNHVAGAPLEKPAVALAEAACGAP